MPQENYSLVERNLVQATGFIVPARSGLITGIAADADVYACVNLNAQRALALTMARIRFVPTTAAASAQCMAIRFSKVFGFTAIHTGGTPTSIQGHYHAQPLRQTAGLRIPTTEIACRIAGTAAMTTATYTAPDDDEPDFYPISGGGTFPSIYEDVVPRDGLPCILEPNTGIVGKLDITMGASLVGRLYVALLGYWE